MTTRVNIVWVNYCMRITGQFTHIVSSWLTSRAIHSSSLQNKLDVLKDKDSIAVNEWRAILAEAAALTPEQPVGIQIGSQVQVQHTGVLGYLVLNSETVADALETYLLFERFFYHINFAELTANSTEWKLFWPDRLGNVNALFVQVALTALVTFMRQRFPNRCELLAVEFTGDAPADLDPYEDYFCCPVSFGSQVPGITFDASTVNKPLWGLLPVDYQVMDKQQHQAFKYVVKADAPFLQRLQQVLLKLLPEGRASLAHIAKDLHMSVRSVQRKLDHYDVAYQELLDGVREQLARRYLLRTSLSLSELTLLLGFSEQSAFGRAFKHWTGESPGAFRLKRQ